jgi:DNA-binding GntR family transcriptional regulator
MDQRKLTIVLTIPSPHACNTCFATNREIRAPRAEQAYRTLRHEVLHFLIRDRRDLLLNPLAARLGLSRTTITRALDRLVEDGLLRCEHRHGYATLETSAEEIEARFLAICSMMKEIYPPANTEVRPPYRLDWNRTARRQRAAIVAKSNDAELVATELELLLRQAASRSAVHAPQIEACLVSLSRVRRVEGELFASHPREVARLMRSFYAGQHDRFIEGLERYTARRSAAAAQLLREVRLKAVS